MPHPNTTLAFAELKASGLLSKRRLEVYEYLATHPGGTTRNELDAALGGGRPNPAHSRRLAELQRLGIAHVLALPRPCSVTNAPSAVWVASLPEVALATLRSAPKPVASSALTNAELVEAVRDIRAEYEAHGLVMGPEASKLIDRLIDRAIDGRGI